MDFAIDAGTDFHGGWYVAVVPVSESGLITTDIAGLRTKGSMHKLE